MNGAGHCSADSRTGARAIAHRFIRQDEVLVLGFVVATVARDHLLHAQQSSGPIGRDWRRQTAQNAL
ncbi:hypothetical protein BZM26_23285 [Paraburkholderia strydomiana]|nr:hypothetical protein BZM26_23285 [Paraburkholderia strydomiana]